MTTVELGAISKNTSIDAFELRHNASLIHNMQNTINRIHEKLLGTKPNRDFIRKCSDELYDISHKLNAIFVDLQIIIKDIDITVTSLLMLSRRSDIKDYIEEVRSIARHANILLYSIRASIDDKESIKKYIISVANSTELLLLNYQQYNCFGSYGVRFIKLSSVMKKFADDADAIANSVIKLQVI